MQYSLHVTVFLLLSLMKGAYHFVNEALPGLFLFLLPCGIPCPQAQEAQHVHLIDFLLFLWKKAWEYGIIAIGSLLSKPGFEE